MNEGYWVIRTYEAGAVGEKTKFWVPGRRPEKAGRKERSELKKQEQNEYSCLKQAARVLNANFQEGDWLIGLDYSDEGLKRVEARAGQQEDEAAQLEAVRRAADREMRNCLRRVKRELAAQGIKLRYHLAITSDMDGDTGEQVRVHHHLVACREARGAFFRRWTLGGVYAVPLSRQKDYLPLAEYLLKQVRRVPDGKKYTCSRNLIRPQPKDRIALSDAEVRVPKGGELLFRAAYRPGQPQYIRYVLPDRRE